MIFFNKDILGFNRSDFWKCFISFNVYVLWIVSEDVDLKEILFGCFIIVVEDERFIYGINIGNEIKVSDKEEDLYI